MARESNELERTRRATGLRNRRIWQAEALGLGPQLGAALDGVAEPLLITNLAGEVVLINRSFEAWSGSEVPQVLGQPIEGVLRGVEQAHWFAAGAQPREVVRVSVRHPADASDVTLSLRPLFDEAGVWTHVCASVVLDTRADTPHGSWLAAQRSTLEAVGRMTAEFAHDINNQLAVVLNYSFVMRRHLEMPLIEHLDELQSAAWRASAMTKKLLGFGRRQVSEPQALDLGRKLEELGPVLQHVLRDGSLRTHVEAELRPVFLGLTQAEHLLIGVCLELREQLGQASACELSLSNLELLPGSQPRDEELPPGRYVMVSASGRAEAPAEGARGPLQPAGDARGPAADPEGSSSLQRLVRQLRGRLSSVSSGDRHALRILLPAR